MPTYVRIKILSICLLAAAVPFAAVCFALYYGASTWVHLTIAAFIAAWLTVGAIAAYRLVPKWDAWLCAMKKKHRSRKIACLTFDDGPDDPWTSQILDILRTEGVKATFFVIGGKAAQNQELTRKIVYEGSEI